MQKYLVRRLVLAVVTLLAVSLIIFILSRSAGDPVSLMLDEYSTQEDIDRMMAKLGTDKPYYQQYFLFLRDAFRGDFGVSIKEGRPVRDVILERLPATMYLGVTAFIVSLLVGIPLGILSSIKRGSLIDQVGKIVALLGQSAPPFWLGIMLIIFFAVSLRVFPPYGRDDWNSIILPAITLGWYYAAANLRLVRSAMLDVLDSEYIKMLRAKGLPSQLIIWKHALRNASLPVITLFGVNLALLVGGALVTEQIFSWPGIGLLLVDAILARDYAVVQTVVFFSAIVIVLTNIVIDLGYAWLDPRVRLT
jgi:peptide/nickel transport system permease protein